MLPILLGYLTGSVPFAYLLAHRAGIDARKVGSGNVGAANVLRTTGPLRGVIAMLLDFAKGVAAVALAHVIAGSAALAALTGAAAVVDPTTRSGCACAAARESLSPLECSPCFRQLSRGSSASHERLPWRPAEPPR